MASSSAQGKNKRPEPEPSASAIPKPDPEPHERAEAVYLIYTIVVGDDGSRLWRVPAKDLEDEQLEILEKYNQAYDGDTSTEKGKEMAEFVENTMRFLIKNASRYERRRDIVGRSIKKPLDVILDVFTLWIQA